MNLLLLLTALLASLTGAGSGDRVLRQVQGVAVVQAAQVAQGAVQRSQRAIPAVPAPRLAEVRRTIRPHGESTVPAATYLPFERRLE